MPRMPVRWKSRAYFARGWVLSYTWVNWAVVSWVYRCVVDRRSWPSSSWIARRSAPSSSRWVPKAWRSVCGCTSEESPRRTATRFTMRPTLRVVSRASPPGLSRPRRLQVHEQGRSGAALLVRAACGQVARTVPRDRRAAPARPHRPAARSAASCPLPRTRMTSWAQ